MVKILNSTYVKADLKQVDGNVIYMNAEERTLLLNILKEFEDFLNGTLGDWDTEPQR